MSQDASGAEVVQVNRKSLWLAAVGFLLLSIGAVGMGWFPGYDRFNFARRATRLGFLMSGIASICASIGTFVVMRRKESDLEHPTNSVNPQIKATFMQLLLFGLGTLLYGVDLIWVGEEDSNHRQFSLLAIAVVMIMIAVISFESHLTAQVGRPAVIITIVACSLAAVHKARAPMPLTSRR